MGGRPSAAVRAARRKATAALLLLLANQSPQRTAEEVAADIQRRNSEFSEYTQKELKALWKAQSKKITSDQSVALEFYQGSGYARLNNALRNETIQDDITLSKYDAALNSISNELPKNTTLTRGIGASARINSDDGFTDPSYRYVKSFFDAFENGTIEGTRFQDRAYSSTSVGKTGFVGTGSNDGYYDNLSIGFRIRAKQGTRVIIPNPDAFGGKEKEILLPKGAKFRVVNAQYGDNNKTLILDVDLED